MNSVLGLRIKSFFLDIGIVISITLTLYFVLKAIGSDPSDKTMNTVRNWVSQAYFLGCLILIPAKTLRMKINKLSFKSMDDLSEVGLWGIVKFYFFQFAFILVGVISFIFFLSGQTNNVLIGICGALISISDLVPFVLKKDYLFFHDKFSGIKIVKD